MKTPTFEHIEVAVITERRSLHDSDLRLAMLRHALHAA